MRRLLVPITVFAAMGLVLSITGLVVVSSRGEAGLRARVFQPDARAAGLNVPEFALTDQEGKPATQQSLDGGVTILDFFFTNCPFVCPGMTTAMADLAMALQGTPVRFVSISVDPAHDTPDRLREYAAAHGADLKRWAFLTGDPAVVQRIVRGSLQFALQPDPTRELGLPDGSKMSNIVHPKKLLLVGPDRRVLGLYDPDRPDEMRDLLARAKAAAKELGPAR